MCLNACSAPRRARRARISALAGAAVILLGAAAARAQDGPEIDTRDVDRFYALYDAADGSPSAETLQAEYLDTGTPGLHVLASRRRVTGERIAAAIAERPELYENARACAAVLPQVEARLEAALDRLAAYRPEADFPSVTIAVGRGRPVGIGYPDTGIQIGLEALCAADFLNADLEDRFVTVIAHEYVHTQQDPALAGETPTVLEMSLAEGIAEFVTERIAGEVGYSHLPPLVAGRELEIETAFAADLDKTELDDWLYNTGSRELADLGYWTGYRVAKAYWLNAADRDQAIRDMLAVTDAHAFLEASGWEPGMAME